MSMELQQTEYDAIVLGTGITESVIAGSLSCIGKSVLHLDVFDFYGSQYAALHLGELHEFITNVSNNKPYLKDSKTIDDDQTKNYTKINLKHQLPYQIGAYSHKDGLDDDLKKEERRYNIGLCCKPLFSSGPIVNHLIKSAVGRYLEFKSVNALHIYLDNAFQRVPCSKGEIFKNKFISLPEKTYLMRFITFCAETSMDTIKEQSFKEFMKEHKLSDRLQTIISYAIALLPNDSNITNKEGLERMKLYIQSLGRFGSTAFIVPLYGASELSQAYCRVAAVYGGTYVLRKGVQALYLKDDKVEGVHSDGQFLKCQNLILNRDYQEDNSLFEIPVKEGETVNDNDHSIMVGIVPPNTFEKQSSTVFITQMNHTTAAAPKGKYVITFQAENLDETILKSIVDKYLKDIPILYQVYYKQFMRDFKSKFSNYKNVHVCDDIDSEYHLENSFKQAEKIYNLICPEEKEMLPLLPNPEGDQEEDETSRILGIEEEKPQKEVVSSEEESKIEEKKEETPEETKNEDLNKIDKKEE